MKEPSEGKAAGTAPQGAPETKPKSVEAESAEQKKTVKAAGAAPVVQKKTVSADAAKQRQAVKRAAAGTGAGTTPSEASGEPRKAAGTAAAVQKKAVSADAAKQRQAAKRAAAGKAAGTTPQGAAKKDPKTVEEASAEQKKTVKAAGAASAVQKKAVSADAAKQRQAAKRAAAGKAPGTTPSGVPKKTAKAAGAASAVQKKAVSADAAKQRQAAKRNAAGTGAGTPRSGVSGNLPKAVGAVSAARKNAVKKIASAGTSGQKKNNGLQGHSAGRTALICVLIFVLVISGIYLIPTKAYEAAHNGLHRPTDAIAKVLSSSKDKKNADEEETDQKQADQKAEESFKPHAVTSTEPDKLIQKTEIQQDGEILENLSDYKASEKISFSTGGEYTESEGILTFRGNNFRDSPTYGTASLSKKKFGDSWIVQTSALRAPDGYVWSGNGWTGQPLIVTWSKKMRQNMNMEDWAKKADTLTEVIYAALDGNIYFLDLKTGKATREPMNLGYTFKGAGSLDPRGYPIMYVGSGYDSSKGKSHAFIINLLDCSVMYEFGMQDSFSLRGNLSFFDSSALVDAETDQLIYPGENGILYIIKLNSKYNEKKGTVSINPEEPVRWRYKGSRNSSWYIGMEDSAVTWKEYIFFTTNDGYMFCLNLNTLETVWVQDVLDDTNCTPVLELEDGHPYIYESTSFHLGWRSSSTAEIPIWKIDAETGEIVWSTSYDCHSVKGNSGGVQGTIAVGKNKLKDLIFVPVAKTPTLAAGKIVALNKKTGKEVWVLEDSAYAWSSPVAVYDKKGNGYVITCDSVGDVYLLDGLTGKTLDKMNVGSNVEASPAVYNNTMVVGTRGQKIYGITLE